MRSSSSRSVALFPQWRWQRGELREGDPTFERLKARGFVGAGYDEQASAARLYETLVPYAGLHAIPHATGPYQGPVDLALGRLARLRGDQRGILSVG